MRRRQAKKHPLIPDPRFNDTDVTYFVNNLMLKGKKSIAFDIFYSAIDKVTDRTGEDGLEQWKTAVDAVTPNVEVRSRRVGGATFQIPQPIRDIWTTATRPRVRSICIEDCAGRAAVQALPMS